MKNSFLNINGLSHTVFISHLLLIIEAKTTLKKFSFVLVQAKAMKLADQNNSSWQMQDIM